MSFDKEFMIFLMNENRIAFFRHRKLVKSLEINVPSNEKQKLIFINDSADFKNIPLTKEASLLLFDLLNYDLIEVKLINGLKFTDMKINRLQVLDKTKLLNKDQLFVVLRELDSMILVDKYLAKFSFISFKSRFSGDLNELHAITYINHQDEKQVNTFFKAMTNFTQFKFKVLKVKQMDIYIVISVLKKETEDDYKLNIARRIQSNLIVHAKIVKSANRNDKSIEIEIVQVFPFCKRFQFFEEETSNNMILCAYYAVNTSQTTEPDSNKDKILLIDVTENKQIFQLDLTSLGVEKVKNVCIDSKLEYITFNDKNKLLWLFRVKDSKQLACLPLYGFVNQIKFNKDNKYVCLNMNDRRLFNILVVDPDCDAHKNRIQELASRQELLVKHGTQILNSINNNEKEIKKKDEVFDDSDLGEAEKLEKLAEKSDYSSDDGFDFSDSSGNEQDDQGEQDFDLQLKRNPLKSAKVKSFQKESKWSLLKRKATLFLITVILFYFFVCFKRNSIYFEKNSFTHKSQHSQK